MVWLLSVLILPLMVDSFVQVGKRSLISYSPCIQSTPMAVKQSIDGLGNETRTIGDTDSKKAQVEVGDFGSKNIETTQDYSKFSSESFSALKDLASASLSIILSGNRINTTTAVKSNEGQNFWSLIDTEMSTISVDENSSIVSI